MAQVYSFVDENGVTRLFAEIQPEPAGSPFNGGTITNGLEIDNPSNSANALTIKEQLGGTVDTIGPGGELHVAANYGQANDIWALRVDPGNNSSARGLEVRNQAGAAAVWYTDQDGSITSTGVVISFVSGAVLVSARADGQTPLTLQPHAAADASLVLKSAAGATVASVSSPGVVTQNGLLTTAITAGALPTVAPSSGVAFQCLATRDTFLCVPFTGDATNNAATLKIELSPDNSTFSILDTLSIAAALNLTGAINTPVTLAVPAAWYVKLTAVHGTIGTATYY